MTYIGVGVILFGMLSGFLFREEKLGLAPLLLIICGMGIMALSIFGGPSVNKILRVAFGVLALRLIYPKFIEFLRSRDQRRRERRDKWIAENKNLKPRNWAQQTMQDRSN